MAKSKQDQIERLRQRRQREAQNPFSMLPAIYSASRAQGLRLLQSAGDLSILEWRVLWDLSEVGALSIKDLAELQRADPSLLSRALPDMKRRGLVTTRKDAEDKRHILIELTEQGRAAYAQSAPTMLRRRQALREHLSSQEIDELVHLLGRLEIFLNKPIDDILTLEVTE